MSEPESVAALLRLRSYLEQRYQRIRPELGDSLDLIYQAALLQLNEAHSTLRRLEALLGEAK